MGHHRIDKLSGAGLLITLGIIYGDIGTSPLYVMTAIIGQSQISELLVLGGLSAVFWTLTLETTVKYIILTLRADNKGEGGIFALFSLLRRRFPYLVVGTMIGGAMLLADGIITPPLSVSSAIEGLKILNPDIPTVPIVMGILTALFMMQRAGTSAVGKFFGPIMIIWFGTLAVLGFAALIENPGVLRAINPMYAYKLVSSSKDAFLVLGAVFLCTTGAEALYSDLGHCGKKNIRISWIFVKTALLLNYFGQGAWLLAHEGQTLGEQRPFFELMPEWFLPVGIAIAAAAAIIASQALISGSFTLVSEAIRLHMMPRFTVKFPSDVKGQIYIPIINTVMLVGCLAVVLIFQESSAMEAAYGLAITINMIMTSILLFYFLRIREWNFFLLVPMMLVFLSIDTAFLIANLSKFSQGGYFTFIIGSFYIGIMYITLRGGKIKGATVKTENLRDLRSKLKGLSRDTTLPKFATHLVYLSKVKGDEEVESTLLYSILHKRPKRADFYWFVHVEVSDEPYTKEYRVNIIEKNDIIKVQFRLGFRIQQKINLYLKQVIEELVSSGEVDLDPHYHAFHEKGYIGDFRFVLIEEEMSQENEMPLLDSLVMRLYGITKMFAGRPEKWFGLDGSSVTHELVPVVIKPIQEIKLQRKA